MPIRLPELLSPAGNVEKLEAALRYGADAVYLAGKRFGMRSAADNFTAQELSEGVRLAHSMNKKIYLTLNILPREDMYPALEEYLGEISGIPVDAFIVADLGVVSLLRRVRPDAVIHVSTQASAVSSYACEMYKSLGASRVVLARELSLEEIKRIRDKTDIELEVFVHGSMCVSYSGLCLLSDNLCGRDANLGAYAQPCRWKWRLVDQMYLPDGTPRFAVEESKHQGELYPIEENEYGSFVMSCRDMCMIEHVGELVRSGVDCLKIEGRMKSAYYTAVTANAYRIALDDYAAGREFDPALLTEVSSVSHRDFGTGHYFDRADICEHEGYLRDTAYLATALEDAPAGQRCRFVQRNKAVSGMPAQLLTPGKIGRDFIIGDMWDENDCPINSTPHAGMIFYTALPMDVRAGDIVRGK